MAVRRETKKKGAAKAAVATEDQVPSDPPVQALPAAAAVTATTTAAASAEPLPRERASETPPRATKVAASSYTVVARRYRPQRFEDVVGQDHVVQSLRNAIRLNRIAQAYLFCGTRGVGKTSIARIFAKCLNCVQGPTESPCQTCDICQAIATGQDVDVIEIDGASNNGVEQVRELRQNASLRPSRSRYKIYYIDEVHMLSTGAFNALLKTLEEPPAHVKFFFATTEANKIPITVLSRCRRYDFAGITPDAIAGTLGEICTREGLEYEFEALQLVARRAGGSLRNAQSLLDRLLASGSPKLTVDVVHSLLGTASDERLLMMLEALAGHEPAAALTLLEQSACEGVQPAELLSGLIDLVRDAMILAVGGGDSLLLSISPRNRSQLKRIVERWTREPIIAALQILGECRSRMRGSVHGRLLLETALVRAAFLEELTSLSSLVERLEALESGTAPRRAEPSGVKIKPSAAEAQAPAQKRTAHGVCLLHRRRKNTTVTVASAPTADGTRSVPVTSEAQNTTVAASAPTADGTRSVPATSEAQNTTMAAPASRADGTRSVSATSEPSRGFVAPAEAGATSDPLSNEVTRQIVAAGTESRAEDAGTRADAVDGLADRAVPERAVAALDISGSGIATEERPAAREAAAAAEVGSPGGGRQREGGPLDLEAIRKLWPDLVKKVDKRLALTLTQVEPIDFEGTDVLVIAAKPGYNSTFADVDSPEAQSKIAQALQRLVHRPVRVKYVRRFLDEQGQIGARRNEAQRADSLSKDPLVQRVPRALRGPARPDGLRRGWLIARELRGHGKTVAPRKDFQGETPLLERFGQGRSIETRTPPAGKKGRCVQSTGNARGIDQECRQARAILWNRSARSKWKAMRAAGR